MAEGLAVKVMVQLDQPVVLGKKNWREIEISRLRTGSPPEIAASGMGIGSRSMALEYRDMGSNRDVMSG
jgi:hypothetical protein